MIVSLGAGDHRRGGRARAICRRTRAGRTRLKLTEYFAERGRTPGRLLAHELLDLIGAHRIQASVLLRGVEGFGRAHQLRTDRLLTLAEDLPAVAIAVDGRARIEALVEPVQALVRRGLITLERARLLDDELGSAELPDELAEAAKLTLYLRRQERAAGRPAFVAVCELLQRLGLAGATVLLGVDGTRRGRRTRATFFGRNADVPVVVVAVGEGELVAAALRELARLLDEPLVTLERVRVCKRDGRLLGAPRELPAADQHRLAMWQKLSVFSSQAAMAGGRSLHVELIRRLRESDAAGVTAVRGFWGFHGDHRPHGERFLQIRRRAPVVTLALEAPGRRSRTFEIVDELTAVHGLVTSELVPALRVIGADGVHGGLRLASERS